MSETTIRDLFRSLEVTLHERLRTIEDVMRFGGGNNSSGANAAPCATNDEIDRRVTTLVNNSHRDLEREVASLREEVQQLRRELHERPVARSVVAELIPSAPLEGIEIVPKREVVIPDVLSIENRLLLNKVARKALEAEEMGEHGLLDRTAMDGVTDTDSVALPVGVTKEEAEEEEVEEEEDVEEEAEEEEEEEEEEAEEEEEELVEEEVAEEEAEEEEEEEVAEEEAAEEVELEEFEYKGSTYYRDGEGNVFMTDEDGELMEEPIGVWNEAKQRIVVKKAAA